MSEFIDMSKDINVASLRVLEAGNLYFSVIIKKQLTKDLTNSDSVFIALKGDKDVNTLKQIYMKEGSFNPEISMLTFFQQLEECYQILEKSLSSKPPYTKEAIHQYIGFKKHFTDNIPSEEYIKILMENVGKYFQKQTGISIEKENNIVKSCMYK